MKKFVIILFIILVAIITTVSYVYFKFKITSNETKMNNIQYENYKDKEIYGTDLATLINKTVDDNTKNNIEKDNNGLYINNEENSIRIDIWFADDEKVHSMEEIYNGDTMTFMQYYNQIKFKCTKIEYHNKTGRVRYLYFEQIAN